eukprot:6065751-Prorocentrum_lima.AAC.1
MEHLQLKSYPRHKVMSPTCGLELVVAHRLTILPPGGQHDPQGVVAGDGTSPLMHVNVVEHFQR